MDELFSGLNSRLRVSGLIADSNMMGIVNSAMEEAYDKVCSKKGDLERLNEKSRFCELAIMQLEWCLKFIQEEVDIYIVESSREREKLVSELTDTRDRIRKRLEETELAIARKDKEMKERMENELRLRKALESKVQELNSLHVTLELEKSKTDRVREFVHGNQICGEGRDNGFCELKNTLNQQFWNIKQKLEDGRVHSTDEVQKLNGSCSNTSKLEASVLEPKFDLEEGNYNMDDKNFCLVSEEVQSNGCKRTGFHENDYGSLEEVLNCCVQTKVTERSFEFEQMGTDIDILKEMLEVGFEMMGNTISLSKVGLLEQQWEWSVEKEMLILVLRGFQGDVEENFKTKHLEADKSIIWSLEGDNSSSLMVDIKSLRHELEQLLVIQTEVVPSMPHISHESGIPSSFSSHVDIGGKGMSQNRTLLKEKSVDTNFYGVDPKKYHTNALQRCGKSDTSLNFQELCLQEDLPGEKTVHDSHHHVAKMIRNHESIIKKKTEEINWLKGEILREKGRCGLRKDKDFDSVKKLIPNIVSRLDRILQKCAEAGVNLDDYEKGNFSLQKTLSDSTLAEEEKLAEAAEKLGNAQVRHLVDADSREEKKQLKQAREDFYIQTKIEEEMHMIVFKGFVEQMYREVENNEMESLIKDDVYTVFLKEMVREWKNDRESHTTESLTREEKLGNAEVSHSVDADSREEIKQLKQARENFYIQTTITEEMHMIFFKGFVEQMCHEVENNELERSIKEDVYTISFKEMVREWNKDRASHTTESLIREEIYHIVFSEVIKDIKSSVSLMLPNCKASWNQDTSQEDLPSATFLLEISNRNNLTQEQGAVQITSETVDGFMILSTESMEMDKNFDFGDWKLEELDEESIQQDDAFDSVKSKLEKALQQIIMSKEQLNELGCSVGVAVGSSEEANLQMALFEGIAQDMPNGERKWNALESIVQPLKDFSKAIINFECIVYEKQGFNIMRYTFLSILLSRDIFFHY